MSAVDVSWTGAALGALGGLGVLLVVAGLRGRSIRLDERLAPYLRTHDRTSVLLRDHPVRSPFPTLERLLAPLLADAGASWVIVGHSERRQVFGDDDALVNRKLHAALAHDLRPILCVGETKPQRDAGQAEQVVVGQVRAGLQQVSPDALQSVVIAYEPVWAIGTGDTATPQDAQAMHATIRATLAELYGAAAADQVRIQYGGSVKPENIGSFMRFPDIDGALVGGASLKADSYLQLVQGVLAARR